MKKNGKRDDAKASGKGGRRLKRKEYEKELRRLQAELCQLQDWVKHKGLRVIVVFEGRDAAGKGGTIKAITERVSPRVFRVVALPAPSDREKTQMYMQRYLAHFPAAGEIVIFDRSWYNRAGVEHVIGFCTPASTASSSRSARCSRATSSTSGIRLSSTGWRSARTSRSGASRPASRIRCASGSSARPTSSRGARWYEYSRARDQMLEATDTRARALAHRALRRQEARPPEPASRTCWARSRTSA